MSGLKVLLLGSGAREHAMAEAILASARIEELVAAPGNAGFNCRCIDLDIANPALVVATAMAEEIDLVVVGPEVPLMAGVADALATAEIACFGPTAEAAMLEGSKSFTREFAQAHNIPGPIWKRFTNSKDAIAWYREFGKEVVVKADGLAAGKGVIVPESREETLEAIVELLDNKTLGEAGATILLEERLVGEEISVFAVSDGTEFALLSTAQDHKRVGEGDVGPNTGGMGAFAPVPGASKYEAEIIEKFIKPVVDGMAAADTPYVGVIYAGLMLCDDGPRLIEYNCRFGDPEAQVIIPLIQSDFLDLIEAVAKGTLRSYELDIASDSYSAGVVLASKGYPVKPKLGAELVDPVCRVGQKVYYAGVAQDGNSLRSAGGRIATATAIAATLPEAIEGCYEVIDQMAGAEMFARQDIGFRHYERSSSAYERAGVSIDAGAETTRRIASAVKSTHTEAVVGSLGGFGGVLDVSNLSDLDQPVLVASTDGVGTKTLLAEQMNMWEGIGSDIVNHCINDVLVQGAKPLFFMDTVASAKLDPEVVGRVVDGMAESCRQANCVLLGGETAEMGDLLTHGGVDVSGTLVGAAAGTKLLPTPNIKPGHLLVGLASSGLHTNGYTLARKVVSGVDLNGALPGGTDISIGEALLAPHRSYLQSLERVLETVDGLAHITGGGFIENLPRVLPEGCGAVVNTSSWEVPALFNYLVSVSGISQDEAYRVFNMGVGMVAIVDPAKFSDFESGVDEDIKVIGEVTSSPGVELNHD